MVELDLPLPHGALCNAEAACTADLVRTGVITWAGQALATDAKGSVTGWPASGNGPTAIPTDPNTGHGQIGAAGDLGGLQCRDGVHCGLVAMDAAPDAGHLSLALRYLPPWLGEAKTLITLNTGGGAKKSAGQNYLYLAEAEGILTLKDDLGLIALDLAAPAMDGPRLVIFSVTGPALSLALLGPGGKLTCTRAMAASPILTGTGHLFIGCRNQRPGLTKTLGAALIADIWLWPGASLLGGNTSRDHAALLAMRRFWLWSEASDGL